MEVCPLSRGMTSKSLFVTLHNDIRFFHPPLPAYPTPYLAAQLPPKGQTYGLTLFPIDDRNDLGTDCSPKGQHRRWKTSKVPNLPFYRFG